LKETQVAGWKDKRKIMQRYDLTAEMYEERYAEEQKAKYKAALENVEITGSIVLDVGCGPGLFFREVTDQSGTVVGVDISRKLLLKAKEQVNSSGNVLVLQADADNLPFKDSFFNAVFAFTVLQNMPTPVETLKELKRVAKRGGKVVVTGLKKAIPLNEFIDALESSDMKIISFVDNEDLKCYVATLAT
jgi:demethylmenaquinone methyltransferase/2-methoxy-6-polyprenyl-1,4-benzoquinol methylase